MTNDRKTKKRLDNMAGWNEEVESQEVYRIHVGDNGSVEFTGEITEQDVKDTAAEYGIKQVGVRAVDGARVLQPDEFPLTEDVVVFQVNKAG
jgi:hypothetical protein